LTASYGVVIPASCESRNRLPSMATILPFNFPPSPQIIEQALACVQAGGVLAVPTDSFYALAVGIFQPAALEQLLAIKGDRAHKPFPVLIGDPSQLDQLVDEVPEVAKKLRQQFWPGLLTLLFKAQAHLPPVLISENGSVRATISSPPLI